MGKGFSAQIEKILGDGVKEIRNEGDSGVWETLKEAGFEKGDFLPLYNFNPNSQKTESFTSTTYTKNHLISEVFVVWSDLFPSGSTSQVFGQALIVPGTDESVDVKIYNGEDGEDVVEVTGITSRQVVTLGPVDYTPPTNNSECIFKWKWRTNPGTNSSTIHDPFISLGVKV